MAGQSVIAQHSVPRRTILGDDGLDPNWLELEGPSTGRRPGLPHRASGRGARALDKQLGPIVFLSDRDNAAPCTMAMLLLRSSL